MSGNPIGGAVSSSGKAALCSASNCYMYSFVKVAARTRTVKTKGIRKHCSAIALITTSTQGNSSGWLSASMDISSFKLLFKFTCSSLLYIDRLL